MTKELQAIQRQVIEKSMSLPANSGFAQMQKAFSALSTLGTHAATQIASQRAAETGAELGMEALGKPQKLAPGLTAATRAFNNAYLNTQSSMASLTSAQLLDSKLNEISQPERLNSNSIAEYDVLAKGIIKGTLDGVSPEIKTDVALKLTQHLFRNQSILANRVDKYNEQKLTETFNYNISEQTKYLTESLLSGDKESAELYEESIRQSIKDRKALGRLSDLEEAKLTEQLDLNVATADYTRQYLESRVDGTEEGFLYDLAKEKPSDLSYAQWDSVMSSVASAKSKQDRLVNQQLMVSATEIKNQITQNPLMTESELLDLSDEAGLSQLKYLELENYRITQQAKLLKQNEKQNDIINKLSTGQYLAANRATKDVKNKLFEESVKAQEDLVKGETGNEGYTADIVTKAQIAQELKIAIPDFTDELSRGMMSSNHELAVNSALAWLNLSENAPLAVEGISKEAQAIGLKINNLIKGGNESFEKAVEIAQNAVLKKDDVTITERIRRASREYPITSKVGPSLEKSFKDIFGQPMDMNPDAFAMFRENFLTYAANTDSPEEALTLTSLSMKPVWNVSIYAEPRRLIQGPSNFLDFFEQATPAFDNQVIAQVDSFIERHQKARRDSPTGMLSDNLVIDKIDPTKKLPDLPTSELINRSIAVEMGLRPGQSLVAKVNGEEERWYIAENPDTRSFSDGILRYPVYRRDKYGNIDWIVDPTSPNGGLFTISFVGLDRYAPEAFEKLSDEKATAQAIAIRKEELFEPRTPVQKLFGGDVFDIEAKRKAKRLAELELESNPGRINEIKAIIKARREGKFGLKEEIENASLLPQPEEGEAE